MNSDAYEYSRCNHYKTTMYSCRCRGYSFRRTCRHVDFLRKKFIVNRGKVMFHNGEEAVGFVERYGEDALKRLKMFGDAYEYGGKIYKL